MNLLKKLLFPETKSKKLSDLILGNSENGQFRGKILNHVLENGTLIGVNEQISPPIITSDTDIQCLTSTNPTNDGHALLAFVDEKTLKNRDSRAIPFIIDKNGIKTLIKSLNLTGMVLISDNGWIYYSVNELDKD